MDWVWIGHGGVGPPSPYGFCRSAFPGRSLTSFCHRLPFRMASSPARRRLPPRRPTAWIVRCGKWHRKRNWEFIFCDPQGVFVIVCKNNSPKLAFKPCACVFFLFQFSLVFWKNPKVKRCRRIHILIFSSTDEKDRKWLKNWKRTKNWSDNENKNSGGNFWPDSFTANIRKHNKPCFFCLDFFVRLFICLLFQKKCFILIFWPGFNGFF